MRWRTSHVLALAAVAALIVALAIASHQPNAVTYSGGMSAPAAPATWIDAASVASLLPSHFDGYGRLLRATGLLRQTSHLRIDRDTPRKARAASPHYGPLYRRPPPSLS